MSEQNIINELDNEIQSVPADMNQIYNELIRVRGLVKSSLEMTRKQFESHQDILDKHAECLEEQKKLIRSYEIQCAKRGEMDTTEELLNYQYVCQMRKSGVLVKNTVIRTIVPALLTLVGVGIFAYFLIVPHLDKIVKIYENIPE